VFTDNGSQFLSNAWIKNGANMVELNPDCRIELNFFAKNHGKSHADGAMGSSSASLILGYQSVSNVSHSCLIAFALPAVAATVQEFNAAKLRRQTLATLTRCSEP
jgi:hypothetical protein